MIDERPTESSERARSRPRTRAEMRAFLEEQERRRQEQARQDTRRERRHSARHARPEGEGVVPDTELIGPDGQYIKRRTLRERRREARERIGPTYVLREIAVVISLALVLSFVLKTWLVQPFFIPSKSMTNTLLVGDRVLVSKLTPHPQAIERGDIVVFEDPGGWLDESQKKKVPRTPAGQALHDGLVFVGLAPNDSNNHLIKRVIGLPGDHVKCCTVDGLVTVNGTPIKEPYLRVGDVPSIEPFDVTVPQGRLWVMGDHRSGSGDSRLHQARDGQGAVPQTNVVGRAVAIAWPFNRVTWLSKPESVFSSVPSATR